MAVTDIVADIADRIARTTRSHFPAGSPLGDALRSARRRLPRRPPREPIARVIFTFARHYRRAFFIQVGAHDGTALDPLRAEIVRRPWSGIMVEPVPYVFERLRANYGRNRRLILENAAIADTDGVRDFHHLPQADDPSLWKWYDALGSFRRDVVLRHRELVPDIEERIVTTAVPCLTFDSLCRKHGVDRVDIVQMDTEGYDLEVLRLIDLQRWQPALVMYEHIHLDDDEQREAGALLDECGYRRMADDMNTLALRQSTLEHFPDLGRLWDGLVADPAGDRP
jgi:FkbM family methyltransferase